MSANKHINIITFGKRSLSFDVTLFGANKQVSKLCILKFLGVTPVKQNSGKLTAHPNWKANKKTHLAVSWTDRERLIPEKIHEFPV